METDLMEHTRMDRIEAAEIMCAAFNHQWPIGTEVILLNGRDGREATSEGQTRSIAFVRYESPQIFIVGEDEARDLGSLVPVNHERTNECLRALTGWGPTRTT